jgi:hypothetical protein
MANFTEALRAIDPALVTPISRAASTIAEPISPTLAENVGVNIRAKLKQAVGAVWLQPEALELRAMLSEIARKSGYAARLKAVAPREAYKRAAQATNLSGEYSSAWGTYRISR